MALEMRDRCERCGTSSAPGGEAFICSYECSQQPIRRIGRAMLAA
jgi:hypothetical protein